MIAGQMKKIFLLIASLLVVPMALANQAYQGSCTTGNTKVLTSGMASTNTLMASFPQCVVSVYIHGTIVLAPIYSDNANTPTPLANPYTATASGAFLFYAGSGEYDIVMSGGLNGGFPSPVTISDVTLGGSGGGGGGVAVFTAPTTSWPAWLVPTVTTPTTTPSLTVAASTIPNTALANSGITVGVGAGLAGGGAAALGGTVTLSTTPTLLSDVLQGATNCNIAGEYFYQPYSASCELITGSGVSLNPTTTQNVVQPSGSSLNVDTFNHMIYAQAGDTVPATPEAECAALSTTGCTYVVTIPQTISVTANHTTPTNLAFSIEPGGSWTLPSTTYTMTIGSGMLQGPQFGQIFYGTFTPSGFAALNGLNSDRPDWFPIPSGYMYPSVCAAVSALNQANGGYVYLNTELYRSGCEIPYPGNGSNVYANAPFNMVPNVHIIGTSRPDINSANTAMVGGSIIIGTMADHASGFQVENVGFDDGVTAFNQFFPTFTSLDSLFITGAVPYDSTHYPYLTGIAANNISCLGHTTTTADHCALFEDVSGARITNVHSVMHEFGVVLKGINSLVDQVDASGHSAASVYDRGETYSPSLNSTLSNIHAHYLTTPGDTSGIWVDADTGPNQGVHLSNNTADGTSVGLVLGGNAGALSDVDSTNFTYNGETSPAGCITVLGTTSNVFRVSITNWTCNNVTSGFYDALGVSDLTLSNGRVTQGTTEAVYLTQPATINGLTTTYVTGADVDQTGGSPAFVAAINDTTRSAPSFTGPVEYANLGAPTYVTTALASNGFEASGLYSTYTANTSLFNESAGTNYIDSIGANGTTYGQFNLRGIASGAPSGYVQDFLKSSGTGNWTALGTLAWGGGSAIASSNSVCQSSGTNCPISALRTTASIATGSVANLVCYSTGVTLPGITSSMTISISAETPVVGWMISAPAFETGAVVFQACNLTGASSSFTSIVNVTAF